MKQVRLHQTTSKWYVPTELTYNVLLNVILKFQQYVIIASLFKNIKYILINIAFNAQLDIKYVVTEIFPTITASCNTFQSTAKAWTHTWSACIFWWCFTITPEHIERGWLDLSLYWLQRIFHLAPTPSRGYWRLKVLDWETRE